MFLIMHRFATSTLFIVIITAFRQNKFFFNENTSVLSVKQEVHNIDYKYTVNLFLLKVLLGFFFNEENLFISNRCQFIQLNPIVV